MIRAKGGKSGLPAELDEGDPPPAGRFCDLVLQGGVINGVAYPGFLMEVARRFHFHAIGGASVGAVAACLLAAAEYRRRYGQLSGFNEGLRLLPQELGECVDQNKRMTRIHSLFQTTPAMRPLFSLILDVIEEIAVRNAQSNPTSNTSGASLADDRSPPRTGQIFFSMYRQWRPFLERHFPPSLRGFWRWVYVLLFLGVFSQSLAVWGIGACVVFLAWVYGQYVQPLQAFWQSIVQIGKLEGFGLCSGMRSEDSPHQGFTEWLYQGIQDMAGAAYANPLTFEDLWRAPCGPKDAAGQASERSIDLFTVSTCLSQGRAYKLPSLDPTARLFFRLSEFKKLFPNEVVEHLRRVSLQVDVTKEPILQRYKDQILQRYCDREAYWQRSTHKYTSAELARLAAKLETNRNAVIDQLLQQEDDRHPDPDIRELPAAQLPIVVAARMSLSVPILFQAVPLLGFDLQVEAEDMKLQRLWFTDGGVVSNFPIHMLDKALPRWPTFGVTVEEEGRLRSSSTRLMKSFVPYFSDMDESDRMVFGGQFWRDFNETRQAPRWKGVSQFLAGVLKIALDGEDQSHLRMPHVRNRVLRLYTNRAIGNAFNIKVNAEKIQEVNDRSIEGGKNLVMAYLSEIKNDKMPPSLWTDHRWVRLQMLIENLREHLRGFETALFSKEVMPSSLYEQIAASTDPKTPPLCFRDRPSSPLSLAQMKQLQSLVEQLRQLERGLMSHRLPMPMTPVPATSLRTQPNV